MEILSTKHLVTKLIILAFFLTVAEYLIGSINLFEFFLGLGIFVNIWVIFSREFSVGFFDLICTGTFIDT